MKATAFEIRRKARELIGHQVEVSLTLKLEDMNQLLAGEVVNRHGAFQVDDQEFEMLLQLVRRQPLRLRRSARTS